MRCPLLPLNSPGRTAFIWRPRPPKKKMPPPPRRSPRPAGSRGGDPHRGEGGGGGGGGGRGAGGRRRREKSPDDEPPDYVLSKLLRALIGRLLFVVHSILTIWQSVQVYQEQAYWSFSLISVAILIEGAVTILQRAGDERKWFCPSVLLYVMATTPPIWLLELDLSHKRLIALTKNGTIPVETIGEVEHTLKISHELWIQTLEQFMLVILIVGRWLLPKGEITREQLSQILLAYLAIASDIVELFDVFKERPVTIYAHLRYVVLFTWSMSLIQFGFVLTTSKARKMRIAITQSHGDDETKRMHNRLTGDPTSTFVEILKDADIWAIVLANALQDVPFLIVRLYLMIGYNIITYTMIFFTCKNFLIIALQSYRLVVLINDRYLKFQPEEDARKLYRYYRQTLGYCRQSLHELKEAYPYLGPHKHHQHQDAVPPKRVRTPEPQPPPPADDDEEDEMESSVEVRRRVSSYTLQVPDTPEIVGIRKGSASHSPRRKHGREDLRERRRPRSPPGSPPPRPAQRRVSIDRSPHTFRPPRDAPPGAARRRGTKKRRPLREDRAGEVSETADYYYYSGRSPRTKPVKVHGASPKPRKDENKPKKRGSYSMQSTYSL